MNNKNMLKIILDIIMTIVFLMLMSISITGINLHEILGLGILALFIIHNILNWTFTKNISKRVFKNRLRTRVKVMYFLAIALLIDMIVMAVSGLLISKTILTSIAAKNTDLWTSIHISSAYLGLVLISIHVGMHWNSIMRAFRKMFKINGKSLARQIVLTMMSLTLIANGLITIIRDDLLKKVLQPLFGGSSSINNNYNNNKGNENFNGNSQPFSNGNNNEDSNGDSSRNYHKRNRPGFSDSQKGNSSQNDTDSKGATNSDNGSTNSNTGINVSDMSLSNDYSTRRGHNYNNNFNNDENSSSTIDANDEGLQQYLGSLTCNGCGRNCPLTNPQCNIGVQQAQQAIQQYNSKTNGSITDKDSDISDFTTIINLLSVMSVFIAGTHYILKFNDNIAKDEKNRQ